jgi:CO dehydrogenase/acetyl-CoA synthase epsilon subunit
MNNYFHGSSTNNTLASNSDSIFKIVPKTTVESVNTASEMQQKLDLNVYSEKKNIIEFNKYKTIKVKRIVKKYEIKS